MTSSQSKKITELFIANVRTALSERDFDKWISRLGIYSQADTTELTITLVSQNRFVERWVGQHFLSTLKKIAQEIESPYEKINVLLSMERGNEKKSNTKIKSDVQINKKNIRLSEIEKLNREYTFENFIESSSNAFARTAATEVAEAGRVSANPLVLYSPSGLGKSHLAQAIASHCLYATNRKVAYVHAEKFFREWVFSIKNKDDSMFKSFYRSLDVLIIDDIHFFVGKERTQEEVFHTFNTLYNRKKQMIFTCDRHPKLIRELQDRIKTRLGEGLTIDIKPPEEELRKKLLQKSAEKLGHKLSEECADFIAKRITTNVRELQGAVRTVVAKANYDNMPITIELVKEELLDIFVQAERNITAEIIQKEVADYYKIKVTDLLSASKSHSIVRPRQMAMTLVKSLTTKSLPEIGRAFGGRDHSTVLYAIKKIRELSSENQQLNQDYKNIERMLLT